MGRWIGPLTLVLLVITSLVLSGRLWTAQPVREVEPQLAQRRTEPVRVPEMSDLIEPVQIIAHFGPDRHTVLMPGTEAYSQAWNRLRLLFGLFPHPTPLERRPTADQLQAWRQEPGFEVVFPISFPIDQWVWVWRGAYEAGPWPETNRVWFRQSSPQVLIWGGESGAPVAESRLPTGIAGVRSILEDVARLDLPRYAALPERVGELAVDPGQYVPLELPPLAAVPVQPGQVIGAMIVQDFFTDLSVVRIIPERDRAVIYTDGHQGLRIYPSGASEYSAVLNSSPNDQIGWLPAVDRVREFVALHGGWPVGAHALLVQRSGAGYHFAFGARIGGWPVVGPVPPLEVVVEPAGVTRYLRNWRPLAAQAGSGSRGERSLLGAEEALRRLQGDWFRVFPAEEQRRVAGMRLVYYLPRPTVAAPALQPVWEITSAAGQRVYLDAGSGELLR